MCSCRRQSLCISLELLIQEKCNRQHKQKQGGSHFDGHSMTRLSWDPRRSFSSGFGLETYFHRAVAKGLDRAEVIHKVQSLVHLEKTQAADLWIQKQRYQRRTQSLRSLWTTVGMQATLESSFWQSENNGLPVELRMLSWQLRVAQLSRWSLRRKKLTRLQILLDIWRTNQQCYKSVNKQNLSEKFER